jgi:hypothetical protein
VRADQFRGILDAQITRVRDILVVKTEEYATDDQLANIRFMAMVQGISFPRAVAGAMAKHTFSVYKMIRSDKAYPIEVWDEKITDHIIWLVLLRASLIEGAENPLDRDALTALVGQMDRVRGTVVEVSQLIINGSGGKPHIPADEILRMAAEILDNNPPNPDQGNLSC